MFVLLVLFIVLKLTHVVDWSWPIVLIPLWIELVLFVGIVAGIGIASGG